MQENLNLETLKKQFQIVKSETNTSHVQEYGDEVSSGLIFVVNVIECERVNLVNHKSLLKNFIPLQFLHLKFMWLDVVKF